jgi:acyl-CoA oxidase
VKTGDLGAKFGYQAKDNGWAQFNNVRIPRTNMLMRICEVDKDGEFKVKGDPKVLYTTMMLIRMSIIIDIPAVVMKALTIAFRYASVRR